MEANLFERGAGTESNASLNGMGLFVISPAFPCRNLPGDRRLLVGTVLLTVTGLFAGCASPGPPLPPSLRLPELAKGLTAERVGGQVKLTWTTAANTTDGDHLRGPIVAVICREIPDAPELARLAQGGEEKRPKPPAAKPNPVKGKKAPASQANMPVAVDLATKAVPCNPIQRFEVSPGVNHAIESLPPALTTGAPTLIGYKVELLNAAQHSAGNSAVAYAAAGAAPLPAGRLEAATHRGGILLRWTAHPTGGAVEVRRTLLKAAHATAAARTAPSRGIPASARKTDARRPPGAGEVTAPEPVVLASPAGTPDPGGMVDASAQDGGTYVYVAQRVLRVMLAGKSLELRGEASPAATVVFRDIFPPAQPAGLEAAVDGGFGRPLSVDLSWEPNSETDLAGYFVLRGTVAQAVGAPGIAPAQMQQINATPLMAPGFRDLTVVAGKVYEYRIVAVDGLGNRSTASEPVRQALPQP